MISRAFLGIDGPAALLNGSRTSSRFSASPIRAFGLTLPVSIAAGPGITLAVYGGRLSIVRGESLAPAAFFAELMKCVPASGVPPARNTRAIRLA